MLDIVFGQTTKSIVARNLGAELQRFVQDGTFYIGYPVLSTADEKIEIDGLLTTPKHGLVAFIFADSVPPDRNSWDFLNDQQNQMSFNLEGLLRRYPNLRSGRQLGITPIVVTLFPAQCGVPNPGTGFYGSLAEIEAVLASLPRADENYYCALQAALQRVANIKPPKKRVNVVQDDSKGSIMLKIEKEIANLDQWQKHAAIETPEGPQRIRGLAGSGKTIVLALKAAYLHAQHRDWKIAITFQTRSLYQQINDLIRRFCFEHLNDEPNWANLHVLHAWGGHDIPGIYTEMANQCDYPAMNFVSAANRYGRSDAFKGACNELLSNCVEKPLQPVYDAVLIDEAQDLPAPFFQLLYAFTKEPKRIIWAYDELQKLSEASMPNTSELFGTNLTGESTVVISNTSGQAREDIILPVCYRNTPWALTLAHALGFGIYRSPKMVQLFDEDSLWKEIGYRVSSGELTPGHTVCLERDSSSSPEFFKRYLTPENSIETKVFETEQEQALWVAKAIAENIVKDELDLDDILVILPDAYTAKSSSALVRECLAKLGIKSHLAGVTTSRDELFSRNSVAFAHIHRSKGNEAPMVYFLNAQQCYAGHELTTLRNILFTGITRSRAWVRICGWGDDMKGLHKEIKQVEENNFKLKFKVPTEEERKAMKKIHRDRSADEKAELKKAEDGLKFFLKMVERGDMSLDNLPPDLRTKIGHLINMQSVDDEFE